MRKIRHDLKTWDELSWYLHTLSQDVNTGGIFWNYRRTFESITEMTRAEEPQSGMRGAKRAIIAWWNHSRPSKGPHNVFATCLGAILLQELVNAIYKDQKDKRFIKRRNKK